MNEWISVKKRLPKPFEIVWIYWRDREVLLGCRVYEGKEENNQPPNEGWYSLEDEKCRNAEWWQYYRIEKPMAPHVKYIYIPKNDGEPIALEAKLYAKFAKRIFLMKSFLDSKNIEYKIEELEDSPFGLGVYFETPSVSLHD